jgi:hypothetical protein
MNSVTASASLTVGAGGSCSAPKNRQGLTSFCEGRVGVSSQRFYASLSSVAYEETLCRSANEDTEAFGFGVPNFRLFWCGLKGAHRYIGKQRLHAILPFSVYSPKPSVLRRSAMRDGDNILEKG